jgi:hypothetical protein
MLSVRTVGLVKINVEFYVLSFKIYECDTFTKKYTLKQNMVRHIKEKHGVALEYLKCPKLACKGNTIRKRLS